MATTITATYQVSLTVASRNHAKDSTLAATIRRISPSSLSTTGLSVSSVKIDLSGVTFYSGSGNNPYLDFGTIGRVSVPSSVSDKSALKFTTPSGFSLDRLLSVTASASSLNIYAHKSTSGNVVQYPSTSNTFTITAKCTQSYTKSTATVTSPVNAGSSATVRFTNSNLTNVYHVVDWSLGEDSDTVTTSIGASTTSCTVPMDWLENIPNSTSGTVALTVTTYSRDGVSLGSNSYSFKVTAPASAVPSISLATTRLNDDLPVAYDNIYVQGKSGVRITATATGCYGSTISSYTISGGDIVTGTTTYRAFRIQPITLSGNVTYKVKATDSRGRSATASVTLYVYPYSPPVLTRAEAFRCRADGTRDDENGTYISVTGNGTCSSLNGLNRCIFTARYALSTSSAYSTPEDITAGVPEIIGDGEIDVNASYNVKINVIDHFTTTSKYVPIGTSSYTVFFKEGGNGVAFGKVAERNNAVEISPDWGLYHGDVDLTGVVGISRGGTGQTTAGGARGALGLGNSTGPLEIAYGGTGETSAAGVRNTLGLGNTTGALELAHGGTGATDAATARTNLGAAASSHNHAAGNITSGTIAAARLPFRILSGSVTITGTDWKKVTFSTAFSAAPIVVVSYANDSSSSGIEVLKTKSESASSFQVCMVGTGTSTTTRTVNWIAIGT